MQTAIIPLSTKTALTKIDDSGFTLLSATPFHGKSTVMKSWLSQNPRPSLCVDFQHRAPAAAQKRELERTLEQSLSNKNALFKGVNTGDDKSIHHPLNISGLQCEALHLKEASDARLIVLLDHLPLRDNEHTDEWLCSIVARYSNDILFLITNATKPTVNLLRLAFEYRGLLLDHDSLVIGLDDLIAHKQKNQWDVTLDTLANICEDAQNNNLVLLHLLNEQLDKKHQFTLPDADAWIKASFKGLDTAEIACIKLLSQLEWTLPGFLTLIMPKRVSRDFSETLSKRLWTDEYTHSGQLLLRLKRQIRIGLSFFTTKLPGIVFKPAHFWLIDTLNRNYLPETDALKTWIGLEKPDYVRQLLDRLNTNGQLKAFAESTNLLTLNKISDDILIDYPLAQATIYARAINSFDAAIANRHHCLWEKYDASANKQPIGGNASPIASEAVILSAADRVLFPKNTTQTFNPVSPLSQIPRWLEISSRLLLTHTICALTHQPPDQKTFSQLEQIALRAANEHDIHTALDALKILALFTLRYGFYDSYLKVSRYLSDSAKHFETHQHAQSEQLKIILQPMSLITQAPKTTELDRAYSNPQILDNAANALLLYTSYAFHYAWQDQWDVTAGFLTTAQKHYLRLSKSIQQYCTNPEILGTLIRLLTSQETSKIEEPNPDNCDYALMLLIQGLVHYEKEAFISAEQCFDGANAWMLKNNFRSELIWHRTVVCFYWMQRGDKKKALAALEHMFELHEQASFILPFALLGRFLKPLLEYGNQQRTMHIEHIKLCTKAFPFLFEESEATPTISTILSKREYEILHYMTEGKSNDEISNLLHRSVGTIKLHAHNIYKKLKVKNRVEAINLYKQAGLLDGSPAQE